MLRPERFRGFGRETQEFLAGVDANNDKRWFDAHRTEYERHYVEPALAFIREISPQLRMVAPRVTAAPKINGSLLRINQDVRFSKDKRPYKERIDLWFWEGERRTWERPGLFIRLTANSLILGSGMRRFVGPQIDSYRESVVGSAGDGLTTLLRRLTIAGYEVGGATRKRVPPGYAADHRSAPLLLHSGLSAFLAEPIPSVCGSRKFVDHCTRHFAMLAPLNDWIRDAVTSSGAEL